MDTGLQVTIFRSRLRAGAEPSYGPVAVETEELARAMPGFVDFKTFTADDGERVSLVTFADEASHEAWRDHPVHREAQQRGRDEFYEEYLIQVCEVRRERRYVRSRLT